MVTSKSNADRGSGWRKIKSPEDLEKVIQCMLNRILMSDDGEKKAGSFASLCNSWTNARKLRLDTERLDKIESRLDALEKPQRETRK